MKIYARARYYNRQMAEVVLITGASSGIGAAAAKRLAERGIRVFGTSRRAQPARGGIEWIAMDVCNDGSVRDGVAKVIELGGNIDALVCNAGYGIFGSVEEVSLDEARAQFETNVFGVLRCVRAVLPGMRERGRGRIVVVGSLAGRAPIPFQAHYSATKAAVDALSQALSMECDPCGIRVSLVEPGDIETAFNDGVDWSCVEGSAYGEPIRQCAKVAKDSLAAAPPPDVVARVIEEALTATNPRFRYSVGPDSWNVPLARRFLPERLFHRLIARRFLKSMMNRD